MMTEMDYDKGVRDDFDEEIDDDNETYQLADLSRSKPIQSTEDGLRETWINLHEETRRRSVDGLNQLLVDTIMLRDLYKKHHWQVSGPHFQSLHILYDQHFAQQSALVDILAERIQTLGGIAIGMPDMVAELTHIDHPPTCREAPRAQITRLLDAHRIVLGLAHETAAQASDDGDRGTEDIIVSQLIADNEKQAWILSEHLVPTP